MARRIVVKGTPGSGKTTLAARLARALNVPAIELDSLFWGPNWTQASAAELRDRVARAIEHERGWVVDGNYDSKLGTLVWDRADLVVWLDLPLGLKLRRLVGRTARRIHLKQPMWGGNHETLQNAVWGRDALFPWTVRAHFRQRRVWPAQLAERPHVRLTTVAQVESWCSGFCSAPP